MGNNQQNKTSETYHGVVDQRKREHVLPFFLDAVPVNAGTCIFGVACREVGSQATTGS